MPIYEMTVDSLRPINDFLVWEIMFCRLDGPPHARLETQETGIEQPARAA